MSKDENTDIIQPSKNEKQCKIQKSGKESGKTEIIKGDQVIQMN